MMTIDKSRKDDKFQCTTRQIGIEPSPVITYTIMRAGPNASAASTWGNIAPMAKPSDEAAQPNKHNTPVKTLLFPLRRLWAWSTWSCSRNFENARDIIHRLHHISEMIKWTRIKPVRRRQLPAHPLVILLQI